MKLKEITVLKKKNYLPFVSMSFRVAFPRKFIEDNDLQKLKKAQIFSDDEKQILAIKLSEDKGRAVVKHNNRKDYYHIIYIKKELKAIGGDTPIKYLKFEDGLFIFSYSKKRDNLLTTKGA